MFLCHVDKKYAKLDSKNIKDVGLPRTEKIEWKQGRSFQNLLCHGNK